MSKSVENVPLSILRRPSLGRTESGALTFGTLAAPATRPTFLRAETDESGRHAIEEAPEGPLSSPFTPDSQRHLIIDVPARVAAKTKQPRGEIFGHKTAYKPLWLLAMGAAGNIFYGTGTTALERALWPRVPLPPLGSNTPPPPFFEPLFGNNKASMSVGIVMTAIGASLATASCALFYQDSCRLAKVQNPAKPNYLRPNLYASAHIVGILLSVAGQFMKEGIRDRLGNSNYAWTAAVPGIIGASMFSVTQAQAASSCEILNRRMPLNHRAAIGFTARFGVGLYVVHAAFMSVPEFSVYAREAARLTAQTATTVAYALPLTTARLGRHHVVDFDSHAPQPSWYALQVLSVYIVGRVLAGFGPDFIQQGLFLPSTNTSLYVFGGGASLAVGTSLCVFALTLFRQDIAAYSPKRANALFGGVIVALLLILAYTGAAQYAHQQRNLTILWVSLAPGVIGAGLRLAILPEAFAFSEVRHGDTPLPQRYHWTEACRALGSIFFGLWGVLNGIPTTSSFAKEAVAVAAGSFATLGMALPTTTSKRAMPQYAWPLSPGATPTMQIDGFDFSPAAISDSLSASRAAPPAIVND